MEFNKSMLKEVFTDARKYNRKFVGVVFELPNFKGRELIINSSVNFDGKEEYYVNTYDDNLRNIRVPEVRIVRAFCFDSMNALALIDLDYSTN